MEDTSMEEGIHTNLKIDLPPDNQKLIKIIRELQDERQGLEEIIHNLHSKKEQLDNIIKKELGPENFRLVIKNDELEKKNFQLVIKNNELERENCRLEQSNALFQQMNGELGEQIIQMLRTSRSNRSRSLVNSEENEAAVLQSAQSTQGLNNLFTPQPSTLTASEEGEISGAPSMTL